jgi:hypothetical protein
MTTNEKLQILSEIDPNIIRLADKGLINPNKTQYGTNYVIALDKNIVVEQFQYYKKYRDEINFGMVRNKGEFLKGCNKVIQNYEKKI